MRTKNIRFIGIVAALLIVTGCATSPISSRGDLSKKIAAADAAYRNLPDSAGEYNAAVASIARQMSDASAEQIHTELAEARVKLDEPPVKLQLRRFYPVRPTESPNERNAIGAPILLDYDTSSAPLYPPDGLVISATAIYRRVDGEPHVSFLSGKSQIALNGTTYPLKIDKIAPITEMARRGQHVARSGLRNMLRPGSMRERQGIFLTEPYDPKKAIVLMVPGLQSTPLVFVDLIKAMRLDPDVSAHFQVWTFLYGTGTPVLVNGLRLRQELEKTIHDVDPQDRDFATRHIVVLGHSMGGLIAHTLVSSSGNSVWASLFVVSPGQLNGDPDTIRKIKDTLIFRRSPNVVRAIFAATPHRGSKLAESWIGRVGASLIRLPSTLQSAFVELASQNPQAPTPEAVAFGKGFNFTSVRALSPNQPAVRALAQLPVRVPFHSIIGQHNTGPVETSTDGVVPYTSSHLDGAASELIVRSGHNVCENRDAQREVIRILRLELTRKKRTDAAVSLALR